MLPDERREQILRIAEKKGFVSHADLVGTLNASESTIRRDLEVLGGLGQIRKTRGGAAYVGESLVAMDVRRGQASAQKQGIGRTAASMVEPGEVLLLDGGTTTLEVARRLIGKSLQIVTNSLPIASLFVNRPEVELIIVGGYVYPKTEVALGPHAVATLKNINVRRLVMSVGGITESGLYNSNALLVETERQMIESADVVTVVSDSSKLGQTALARLCGLDCVDEFVVDAGISEHWRETLVQHAIDVTVCEPG